MDLRCKKGVSLTFSFFHVLQMINRLLHPSTRNEWLQRVLEAIVCKIWKNNCVDITLIYILKQKYNNKHNNQACTEKTTLNLQKKQISALSWIYNPYTEIHTPQNIWSKYTIPLQIYGKNQQIFPKVNELLKLAWC